MGIGEKIYEDTFIVYAVSDDGNKFHIKSRNLFPHTQMIIPINGHERSSVFFFNYEKGFIFSFDIMTTQQDLHPHKPFSYNSSEFDDFVRVGEQSSKLYE
jgi:hypothetical protein